MSATRKASSGRTASTGNSFKFKVENVPAHIKAINPHLFAGDAPVRVAAKPQGAVFKDREVKLNLAEQKVLAWAQRNWPTALIIPHGLTLKFPDGTRYNPDIVVYDQAVRPILIECKSGYRGPGWEQGHERFRRARDLFGEWFELELVDARDIHRLET